MKNNFRNCLIFRENKIIFNKFWSTNYTLYGKDLIRWWWFSQIVQFFSFCINPWEWNWCGSSWGLSEFKVIQHAKFKASGKVTDKSDAYKFVQLLLELLTGEDSSNITRLTVDKDSSLVAYMQSHTQVLCINEIVNPAILVGIQGASLEQQLQAVQYLALTCIEEDPQKKANYGTCHQTTQADWEVRSITNYLHSSKHLLAT